MNCFVVSRNVEDSKVASCVYSNQSWLMAMLAIGLRIRGGEFHLPKGDFGSKGDLSKLQHQNSTFSQQVFPKGVESIKT